MSESNTEEFWDFDQIRLELDDRLSELTGIRYNLLRLEVDAILFNQPINIAERVDTNEQQNGVVDEPIEPSAVTSMQIPGVESENGLEGSKERVISESEEQALDNHNENSESSIINHTDKIKIEPTEKDKSTQLKILRQKGFELACKIARSAEIEAVVMQAKCGLGFFMESPGQPLAADSISYYYWWLLFGLSEQNVNNELHYPMWAYTDLYSRFGEDQRNQDNSLVNWVGSEPGITKLIYELLHQQQFINDQVFTDIFRLMENCRKIRSNFLDPVIWEEQS